MSWAVHMANDGHDAHYIAAVLSKKPKGSKPVYSMKYMRLLDERGSEAADAYARRTAEKAVKRVRDNPAIIDNHAARVHLAGIRSTADRLPWATYAGSDARKALEGPLIIAERLGSVSYFGLAIRQWAEVVGTTDRTVRTQRDLLLRLGWLKRNPRDRDGKTARYKLTTPPHIHSHVRDECAGAPGVVAPPPEHDAFRADALGSAGWYVLYSLPEPTPRSLLMARTGFATDDLDDVLRHLDRYDLVELADSAVTSTFNPDRLAFAARSEGTHGQLAADKEQHVRDREAFRSRGEVNVRDAS